MKVYISGPITGKENGNRAAFKAAADALIEKGLTPINPHDVGDEIQGSPSWLDFMKVDIKAMLDADAVFVLPGWRESRGAMVEVRLSEMLGFPLFDQFDDLVQFCETTERTAS
jgi:nucleoside 2-deoxyribosyltransferase